MEGACGWRPIRPAVRSSVSPFRWGWVMASGRAVYVIDDDIDVRESLVLLVQRTYRTVAFESARAFLAARVSAKDSCALVDIRMPEMNGLQLQREIRRTMPEMPVIIMTGHDDNGHFWYRPPDFSLQLKTVHLRHTDVDERARVFRAHSCG